MQGDNGGALGSHVSYQLSVISYQLPVTSYQLSREAQLFVGWVSGSVTHAGVGFQASTQPTFILYLISPTHLSVIRCELSVIRCELSVIRCEFLVISYQLSVIRCEFLVY
ncbi:hypothetical protein B1L04_27330 [Microcystis aeruginosa KW]|uniref:Uncharacterized protein n=1 Tax=Microcystis aeruginosa KW TaxID=1960155 RepID=A0A1V4BPX2_MICAE|nr:hypothetical protein B1L04_27330 [Microcystis aeruginosa KW]